MINATAARTRQTDRPSSVGSVAKHSLLRQGASGAEVKQLQRAMNAAGVKTPVNGKFDAQTTAAVRAYQRTKGLQVDGVVGQQTWGSFVGKRYPPGSQMLAGASRPHTHPAAGTPGRPTVQGPSDSFEGPGQARRGLRQRAAANHLGGARRQRTVPARGCCEGVRRDDGGSPPRRNQSRRDEWVSHHGAAAVQQSLYAQYGSPRAARPGYSNHQNRIAMDISGVGGRGTSADRWLVANASKFGFRNLPREFWHYDFVG